MDKPDNHFANKEPPTQENSDPYNPFNVSPQYFAEYSADLPNKFILGEDSKHFIELGHLYTLSMSLCRHDYKDPFSERSRYGRSRLEITYLGDLLLRCIPLAHEIKGPFPHHEIAPDLNLLIDYLVETDIPHDRSELDLISGDELTKFIIVANGFAQMLRYCLLSKGMKEEVKSYRRNARERYKHFMNSAKQRIDVNSKVLLIRLDHGERRNLRRPADGEIDQNAFIEQALCIAARRDKMLKHLQRTFKTDLLFYAWKIEYGRQKGWHIHWFIMLDGSRHQDQTNIPFHIAKHWDAVIGNGATHTQNINAMSSGGHSGLQVMHYSDPRLWKHLVRIADYLTKVDYTIKLRLPAGMRTFGCSKSMNYDRAKPGPKRKYTTHEMDFLAERRKLQHAFK